MWYARLKNKILIPYVLQSDRTKSSYAFEALLKRLLLSKFSFIS